MRWNAKIELVAKALIEAGENATAVDIMRKTGQSREVVNRYLDRLRTLSYAKCELIGIRYFWSPTKLLIDGMKQSNRKPEGEVADK
jgi:hypothetical protein